MAGSGGGTCPGRATCGNGTVVSGYFDCNDMDGGEDGDTACGSNGASTSCDCD